MYQVHYKWFKDGKCVGAGYLFKFYHTYGWAKRVAQKYVVECPMNVEVVITKIGKQAWDEDGNIIDANALYTESNFTVGR